MAGSLAGSSSGTWLPAHPCRVTIHNGGRWQQQWNGLGRSNSEALRKSTVEKHGVLAAGEDGRGCHLSGKRLTEEIIPWGPASRGGAILRVALDAPGPAGFADSQVLWQTSAPGTVAGCAGGEHPRAEQMPPSSNQNGVGGQDLWV